MSGPKLTASECETVLCAALVAGDLEGCKHALHLLAIVDPARADLVMKTIQVGIAIKKERDAPVCGTSESPQGDKK